METIKGAKILRASERDVKDFDWGQLTWYASGPLDNADEMTVGICVIKPGERNPRHSHPNCEEVLYVLEGKITHSIDDEEVILRAGDAITVPPHIAHDARNIGDSDCVLLVSFSTADREMEPEA
jgi:quercetin dioxygenase-like cupin family protein